jgi:hypothetical protein
MDDENLYIIHLNSSNVSRDASGTPQTAADDSNFTTTIVPINLDPKNNYVVGVIDVSYYNINLNSGRTYNNSLPINVYCDIGLHIRDGTGMTDLIYQTKPQDPNNTDVYIGERNTQSILGWRPLANKSIQKINVRLSTAYTNEPIKTNTATRGYNSITLAIMKLP